MRLLLDHLLDRQRSATINKSASSHSDSIVISIVVIPQTPAAGKLLNRRRSQLTDTSCAQSQLGALI
jgi:hypothetical protein